jgi:hypothetical protein
MLMDWPSEWKMSLCTRAVPTWRVNCRGLGNQGTIKFVFEGKASVDSLQKVSRRDSSDGFAMVGLYWFRLAP